MPVVEGTASYSSNAAPQRKQGCAHSSRSVRGCQALSHKVVMFVRDAITSHHDCRPTVEALGVLRSSTWMLAWISGLTSTPPWCASDGIASSLLAAVRLGLERALTLLMSFGVWCRRQNIHQLTIIAQGRFAFALARLHGGTSSTADRINIPLPVRTAGCQTLEALNLMGNSARHTQIAWSPHAAA